MNKRMTYLDIWWAKGTKNISLINYKEPWMKNGNPPMWKIRTNGAKRKNGDSCFNLYIQLGYLVFNYTNFNLQGKWG